MNPTSIIDKNWQLHRMAEQLNRSLQGPARYLELIAGRNSELYRIAGQLDHDLQGPAKYLELIAGRDSELHRMAEQLNRSLQGPARHLELIANRNSELYRIAGQINHNLLEPAKHLNAIIAKNPEWHRMMEQVTKQTQVPSVAETNGSDDLLEKMDCMRSSPSLDTLMPSGLSPDLSVEKSDRLEHVESLLEEMLDTATSALAVAEDLRACANTFLPKFEKIAASNNRLAWISTWFKMAVFLMAVISLVIEIAGMDDTSISDDLSAIKASVSEVKADISTMRDIHSHKLEQLINNLQDGTATQGQTSNEMPESETSPD